MYRVLVNRNGSLEPWTNQLATEYEVGLIMAFVDKHFPQYECYAVKVERATA